MRAVLTRVRSASVEIDGKIRGKIGKGFLILLGVHQDDTEKEAAKIADKICGMRIFEDENGKMNINPVDAGAAELLIISQFTLFADCKSRRPGFSKAARPETAIPLYEKVIELCREKGFKVETGEFGADMLVSSENDGPLTILLDTKEL
ncbi:MAG: D-aminoacyl-tRNA deacylase [Candidatus Limivicinus sp.]|jgi:D-tyrosyl-tRNA(Tyr) deacylase